MGRITAAITAWTIAPWCSAQPKESSAFAGMEKTHHNDRYRPQGLSSVLPSSGSHCQAGQFGQRLSLLAALCKLPMVIVVRSSCWPCGLMPKLITGNRHTAIQAIEREFRERLAAFAKE